MKNTIIISLGCLICFVGGLYLGVTKVEEQTAKWDVKYKETDDKVSAFVEVSDPNTVRSYIKQLNDMLDNMSRLGKIIESGQELDNALIDCKQWTILAYEEASHWLAFAHKSYSKAKTTESIILIPLTFPETSPLKVTTGPLIAGEPLYKKLATNGVFVNTICLASDSLIANNGLLLGSAISCLAKKISLKTSPDKE